MSGPSSVGSLALAQAFLSSDLILPSVAIGIGVGYTLRWIVDPPRWQAIELIAWIVDFQDRAERRADQPELPPDVVAAHRAYLEAYRRSRDTGNIDVSAWRAATEAIAEPGWRLPQIAMIAGFEAVPLSRTGIPAGVTTWSKAAGRSRGTDSRPVSASSSSLVATDLSSLPRWWRRSCTSSSASDTLVAGVRRDCNIGPVHSCA